MAIQLEVCAADNALQFVTVSVVAELGAVFKFHRPDVNGLPGNVHVSGVKTADGESGFFCLIKKETKNVLADIRQPEVFIVQRLSLQHREPETCFAVLVIEGCPDLALCRIDVRHFTDFEDR